MCVNRACLGLRIRNHPQN